VRATVLLVEDDDGLSLALGELIGRSGFAVARAATTEQARRQLFRRRYDAVVCDRRLPDGGGDGVLALAKALDGEVRTILISGDLEREDRLRFERDGIADCCLAKGAEVVERLVDELPHPGA
jgi:DNA-binding NtrC family response regulator